MTTIPVIEAVPMLHSAYTRTTGIETPILPMWERGWFDAHKAGLTGYDLVLVLKYRMKQIKAGKRWPESLLLRNLIGSDERIADLMNEAAMLRARMRVPKVDPNKASVMEMTGRELKPKETLHKSVKDVLRSMYETKP